MSPGMPPFCNSSYTMGTAPCPNTSEKVRTCPKYNSASERISELREIVATGSFVLIRHIRRR